MRELPPTYHYALEQTADAVIITSPETLIEYVNPAFTRITGYDAEEVLGKKPNVQGSEHTTPKKYRDIWTDILSSGFWSGEIVNKRKSGEAWTAKLTISKVSDDDGRTLGYVGVASDISDIKQLQEKLKDAGLEAIYMLAVACEAKDETTGNHIARVQHYAYHVACRLGLPEREAEEIGYSSTMHDLGKIHVPDGILMKPGPLSKSEWREMRKHPANGVLILRDAEFYRVARDIAENHHERWDGKGYPDGKRGGEIPLAARIVSVADVFDALASQRPYKKPWPVEQALEELRGQKGKAFDPEVVDAFMALHGEGVVGKIQEQFPAETVEE